MEKAKHRCGWEGTDPLYVAYHDTEWCVPLHDDLKLFEFIILEGMQAGLSWITILKKLENYRKAFDNFNPEKMARYTQKKLSSLMADKGIIRNRLKIEASVQNARAYLSVQEKYGSFDSYLWQFVDGSPLKNTWRRLEEIPAKTDVSTSMSKDMKEKGFKFVGPTICYAHMQAIGMVNDHLVTCFRYEEV